MRFCSPEVRPSGADNFLKWRRSIDEHLELRRLTWDEYALFNWLCTKADPRTGTLRTSWRTLAEQTTLSANYVGKLCASLKRKGYIEYPTHRGRRRSLVEVAIGKFPLPDGTYTTLAGHPGRTPSEASAEVLAELLSEVGQKTPMDSASSTSGRNRNRQENSSLRVRMADATQPDKPLTKAEALAQAPPALRETLELFCFKTGRDGFASGELEWLRLLDQAHMPAVIQKAITTAVGRFEQRREDPATLTLRYLWESLRHYTTRTPRNAQHEAHPNPPYPTGLTRLW